MRFGLSQTPDNSAPVDKTQHKPTNKSRVHTITDRRIKTINCKWYIIIIIIIQWGTYTTCWQWGLSFLGYNSGLKMCISGGAGATTSTNLTQQSSLQPSIIWSITDCMLSSLHTSCIPTLYIFLHHYVKIWLFLCWCNIYGSSLTTNKWILQLFSCRWKHYLIARIIHEQTSS